MFQKIWYEQQQVGTLTDEGFTYTPEWGDFPLSVSLPLSQSCFSLEEVSPFFLNLLPEGEQRENLAYSLVQKGLLPRVFSAWDMLCQVGEDVCGALQILPSSNLPLQKEMYADFDLNNFSGLFEKKKLRTDSRLRFSLAGEQQKVALLVQGESFSLPLFGSVSSHILKFQSSQYPFAVENESFCTHLAHEVGLPVHEAELLQGRHEDALLITRFDRKWENGHFKRIHCEDFCQALALSNYEKYDTQTEDGFKGLEQCFSLLSSEEDRENFLDMFIYNCLIGNAGAHKKNFSLLITPDGFMLSPFYDLVCTQVYDSVDRNMALALNNKFVIEKFTGEDYAVLATMAQKTKEEVKEDVSRMCFKVKEEMYCYVDEQMEYSNEKVKKLILYICKIIEKNSSILEKSLLTRPVSLKR